MLPAGLTWLDNSKADVVNTGEVRTAIAIRDQNGRNSLG